jgi:hypothetical protein
VCQWVCKDTYIRNANGTGCLPCTSATLCSVGMYLLNTDLCASTANRYVAGVSAITTWQAFSGFRSADIARLHTIALQSCKSCDSSTAFAKPANARWILPSDPADARRCPYECTEVLDPERYPDSVRQNATTCNLYCNSPSQILTTYDPDGRFDATCVACDVRYTCPDLSTYLASSSCSSGIATCLPCPNDGPPNAGTTWGRYLDMQKHGVQTCQRICINGWLPAASGGSCVQCTVNCGLGFFMDPAATTCSENNCRVCKE